MSPACKLFSHSSCILPASFEELLCWPGQPHSKNWCLGRAANGPEVSHLSYRWHFSLEVQHMDAGGSAKNRGSPEQICSGNPKCSSSSLDTFLVSYPLHQTEMSLLPRGWKFIMKSLFFRMSFLWDGGTGRVVVKEDDLFSRLKIWGKNIAGYKGDCSGGLSGSREELGT